MREQVRRLWGKYSVLILILILVAMQIIWVVIFGEPLGWIPGG